MEIKFLSSLREDSANQKKTRVCFRLNQSLQNLAASKDLILRSDYEEKETKR